jgi:hypothetical protein
MYFLACGNLTAMMNGVDLPETVLFSLPAGVEGADGDAAFQGIQGFGEAFPFLVSMLPCLFLGHHFGNIFHEAMRPLA